MSVMFTKTNMLKELTRLKDEWCIKVKIIRLRKLTVFKNPLETWKIEMVLQDEEENKIVATVKQSFCPQFEKSLQEGKCIYISTFGVGESQGSPYIVDNAYKINFYKSTVFTPCDTYNGPIYGFRFKSFAGLLQEEQASNVSYDLIGDLTSCGNIEHAMVDGDKRPYIRLELEDVSGNKLRNITLWSDYAHQLNNALGDRQNLGHVVIILQFMKHKIYIWDDCTVLELTTNMRLRESSDKCNIQEIKDFGDWILKMGDGRLGGANNGEATVDIPDDLLITDNVNPIPSLVEFVYPSFLNNLQDSFFFQERAILAPTHEVVEVINEHLLSQIPSDEVVYYSSDSICESEGLDNDYTEFLYSPEVLNGLKLSGIPNHKLALKVGAPVMLLRNIDQTAGLCNGTRLRILKLGEHIIEAQILTGTNVGHTTIIPRLKLSPSDKRLPLKINRRQFPLAVCFAMTINKSQGQSLSKVGIFLPKPVFTHGQLYVAVSRVKSRKGLKVLIYDKDGKVSNSTLNVVYHEVLQKI